MASRLLLRLVNLSADALRALDFELNIRFNVHIQSKLFVVVATYDPALSCKAKEWGLGWGRKEGKVLFNDALNTFYLRLYSVGHMVKDHSDNEGGNPLPSHRLLFPICSKGSFICIIPQTG